MYKYSVRLGLQGVGYKSVYQGARKNKLYAYSTPTRENKAKHDTCLKISFEDTKEGVTAHLTFLKRRHLGCAFKATREPD